MGMHLAGEATPLMSRVAGTEEPCGEALVSLSEASGGAQLPEREGHLGSHTSPTTQGSGGPRSLIFMLQNPRPLETQCPLSPLEKTMKSPSPGVRCGVVETVLSGMDH